MAVWRVLPVLCDRKKEPITEKLINCLMLLKSRIIRVWDVLCGVM